MILVDTSAWVEYLRGTGSPTDVALTALIGGGDPLATTDVVVMEVLAGGRSAHHVDQLRRLLGRCRFLPVEGLADYEAAAALYRRCRRAGTTVRASTDCLVAAVALRTRSDVLHADRDFDLLARHTGLRVTVTRTAP